MAQQVRAAQMVTRVHGLSGFASEVSCQAAAVAILRLATRRPGAFGEAGNKPVSEEEGSLAPCYVGTLKGECPAWLARTVETDQVLST